jgi:DNA-binding GntR family transcriptional regulator
VSTKKFTPSLNLGSLSPTRNQLVDILRESIIFGTLPPGTQIKQEEICKQFSCSPGPVREALRELESEGLLFHYPNRGVFVAEVSNHEIAEVLIPMRLLLEKFALCNSGLKFTSQAIESLDEQITAMRIGAETGNSKMAEEADARFHLITMQVGASEHTLQLWNSILSRIRLKFARMGPMDVTAHKAAEHQKLLDALVAHDPDHISQLLEEHIVESVIDKVRTTSI